MTEEITKMINILSSFLGEPKERYCESSYQIQFACPRCVEKEGECERSKMNLEINLRSSVYNCWKCSSSGDEEMHGKISKLFKLYGNDDLWNEYKECLSSIRNSELYKVKFSENDFNGDTSAEQKIELEFPCTYKALCETDNSYEAHKALDYLNNRGISWDRIKKYQIGYTKWDAKNPLVSNRIILPSFNVYDELNYWVGRDFTGKSKMKYWNAKSEKKDIIFNEKFINWDADITLVEGPMDFVGVGINCIPLLGKALTQEFKLYNDLFEKANANINIFLDGDAKETAIHLYKILNQQRLYGKIRIIPTDENLDPADIYKLYGKKGIIAFLSKSIKLPEYSL